MAFEIEDFGEAIGDDCEDVAWEEIDSTVLVMRVWKHCDRKAFDGMTQACAALVLEMKDGKMCGYRIGNLHLRLGMVGGLKQLFTGWGGVMKCIRTAVLTTLIIAPAAT